MATYRDSAPTSAEEDALNELTAQLSQFNWKDGIVDKAKRLLYSSDLKDNISGVVNLKAMLCIGREEVYEVAQEVIDGGVTGRLVEFLNVENRDLQWSAAFCLTNVAAGLDSQTETVVNAGAVEPLIRLLTHPDAQLRRQAIFCLANIAGSTPHHRVLLAEHPQFFTALFSAARLALDPKILELICWNLRNVCLLGGPSFHSLKPGIFFFVDKILKQHWTYKDHSVCVGFALETLGTVCQVSEGRDFLLAAKAFPCLMLILSRLPSNSNEINESALRVATWFLVYESRQVLREFLRSSASLKQLTHHVVPGYCGRSMQELALKCFTCVASDSECLVSILQNYPELLNLMRNVFLMASETTLFPIASEHRPAQNIDVFYHDVSNSNSDDALRHKPSRVARLCCAFIFGSLVSSSLEFSRILEQFIATSETVSLLVSMLELITNSLGIKPDLPEEAEMTQPNLPGLIQNTAKVLLQALKSQLQQGEIIRRVQALQQNPVEQFLLECDGRSRLECLFQMAVLPPETVESLTEILSCLSLGVVSR